MGASRAPKPASTPAAATTSSTPCPLLPALGSAGVKWVSGYPGNQLRGLPYINGLLILNDPDTGLPLAVMDCVWITAARTGAATALAARYLARPESSVAGILGCGVQGRSNLEALSVSFPITGARAYDTNADAARRFAEEMSARLDIEVRAVAQPREAVAGCDLVVTAGPILKHPHATIKAGWLEEGAFASLVDYDTYWDRAALKELDLFCTDDVPQLRHYQEMGYFQDIPPIHADLGELAVGRRPGRTDARQRTASANLGLALDDMAVAPLVYRRALEMGLGTWLPL